MKRFIDIINWSLERLPPINDFYNNTELVSIDEALQPIESQIKELSHYVEIAKNHCHYPNEHGLSKDQAASIYLYTMDFGENKSLNHVLNQALQSKDQQILQIWFPYLKLFDTALNLLPTVKESVWRGIHLDIVENLPKNQIFTCWTICSCSLSADVIERFLQDKKNSSTLALINVINGKKISGYTQFENENEVILKIGTQFRIVDDSQYVHLTEVTTPNQWKSRGKIIAGGNGAGDKLDQLFWPLGICIDNEQHEIYIADSSNHRIVKWKFGETDDGQIIAGGNGRDQLYFPTDIVLDKNNKSLIICDQGNRRIVRCSLQNQQDKEILISNISSRGIAMNKNGDLFISDFENHQIIKWTKDSKETIIVAGGNGKGQRRNQLDTPTFIFVDRNDTVYISDHSNHRVMKWMKGAKEGIVVAGGLGKGNSLRQLCEPMGLTVDEMNNIYVTDAGNHRLVCWPSGSKEGRIVLGGNREGIRLNQFNYMGGLTFDCDNNLYVVDYHNHRILRFLVSITHFV